MQTSGNRQGPGPMYFFNRWPSNREKDRNCPSLKLTTTTTTTLRPLVRARFWLHSSQCKRAKMCIFIHWQQCFHASCARSKCIVKNNVSWWRLLVMIAFFVQVFLKKLFKILKTHGFFWKNVLRIGFFPCKCNIAFSVVMSFICNLQ